MAATTKMGLLQHICFTGSNTSAVFGEFLAELKDTMKEYGILTDSLPIVFMDGAPYHTSVESQSTIKELGIRVLVNCAYTPELNPAEQYIKVHKALLSHQLRQQR